jgi:hypothetical protein
VQPPRFQRLKFACNPTSGGFKQGHEGRKELRGRVQGASAPESSEAAGCPQMQGWPLGWLQPFCVVMIDILWIVGIARRIWEGDKNRASLVNESLLNDPSLRRVQG